MTHDDRLAEQFEAHRTHLRAVAYRMLGSTHEADDAVQEAWLRLDRADSEEVRNLGGWLTTVVARICLDMLRSRGARREQPLEDDEDADAGRSTDLPGGGDPEREAVLADTVGTALLVVLERLAPAERLAFVLHDLFALPFDEIARVMGRSPAATRQLASRARRRVQHADTDVEEDRVAQHRVVDAFLTASRGGDLDALLALLDPDAVVRADAVAVRMGAQQQVIGAEAVAETFRGRARAARLALVDGYAGAVWSVEDDPRVVFAFTVEDGRITEIEMIADEPRRLDLAEA